MKKIGALLLFTALQFQCINGNCQSNQPDTVAAYLASSTGLKKAEAYYNVIFKYLRADHTKAKLYMNEYQALAVRENDPIFKAYVHVNYGLYYSVNGNMDSAIYHLEEAKRVGKGKNKSQIYFVRLSPLFRSLICINKCDAGTDMA